MAIVVLEAIHYPPDGAEWRAIKTRDPTFAQIEAAVRSLDRDAWPYVWLHTSEPVDGEVPENCMCIMGGRGEFSICLWRGGAEIHYVDKGRSDDIVGIWESDQGSEMREKNLCNDLSKVLAIAKHFARTETLSTDVEWEGW